MIKVFYSCIFKITSQYQRYFMIIINKHPLPLYHYSSWKFTKIPFSSHFPSQLHWLNHNKPLLSTGASYPQLPVHGSLNSFSISSLLTAIHPHSFLVPVPFFHMPDFLLSSPGAWKVCILLPLHMSLRLSLNTVSAHLPSELRSFSSSPVSVLPISILGCNCLVFCPDNHSSRVSLSNPRPCSYSNLHNFGLALWRKTRCNTGESQTPLDK